jgi:nitroreductase
VLDQFSTAAKALAFLLVAGVAAYWTVWARSRFAEQQREIAVRDERIASLGVEIEQRDARIRQLDAALRLLKVDQRVARLEVIAQAPATDGVVETQLRFTELRPDGAALAPALDLRVRGTRVYIEALVIRFDDTYVEQGDALRGTSVCLFARAFGDLQEPAQGPSLDASGQLPRVYADEEGPDAFYADLWKHFWEYAHDPRAAEAKGVRALQAEAPSIEARVGRTYRVELRASGGLLLRAE